MVKSLVTKVIKQQRPGIRLDTFTRQVRDQFGLGKQKNTDLLRVDAQRSPPTELNWKVIGFQRENKNTASNNTTQASAKKTEQRFHFYYCEEIHKSQQRQHKAANRIKSAAVEIDIGRNSNSNNNNTWIEFDHLMATATAKKRTSAGQTNKLRINKSS